MNTSEINIPVSNSIKLKADLNIPSEPNSLIIFSHGSGSSRWSPRNKHVASILNDHNMATLLTDLLTEEEDKIYENRFNIDLISNRLLSVINYTIHLSDLKNLPVGCFGASTGAASALKAASRLTDTVKAVVSRGGRPDLAGEDLIRVKAPTLLIVGALDSDVIIINEHSYSKLNCEKELQIVNGASHLFEEPGKLNEVSKLALNWFREHLIQNVQTSAA